MTWLLAAWKYKSFIGYGLAGLLLFGLWTWNGVLRDQREALEKKVAATAAERDKAIDAARVNAEQVLLIELERQRTVKIIEDVRAGDKRRQDILNEVIKEVNNAPVSDCPAGDRLDAANRGLLRLSGEKAGH